MLATKELSRFEILLSQFPNQDIYMDFNTIQSLRRIFSYLYKYTDIYYLTFTREEMLIAYLKYHGSKQFEIVSFVQVVKDIKIFLRVMRNIKGINCDLEIDLTLQNTDLWIDL